ncbi:hypothetical protein N7532_011247 [Penicillium argentinense]|uniref:Uncharacterized protein n=1 Tax=Penicillium argentinense TaxID=1131581 RepID=A0A9W9EI33_9EURO|nr:uncharacterized protein N7532_011247 [Penicillium argentinense]KAJ5082204.1 hypothetical protein N7532_011247 [Penicillium argentinense]
MVAALIIPLPPPSFVIQRKTQLADILAQSLIMTDASEHTQHISKIANFLDFRVADNVENKDILEAEKGAVGPNNTNKSKKTQPGGEIEEQCDTPVEHLGSARDYGKGGGYGPHGSHIINKIDPRVSSSSKETDTDGK